VPLDNYSADTLDLLTKTVNEYNEGARLVEGCSKLMARQGAQCSANIPGAAQSRAVSGPGGLRVHRAGRGAHLVQGAPHHFRAPRETIDKLRAVGRRLLSEDPQFQNLLKALNGRI